MPNKKNDSFLPGLKGLSSELQKKVKALAESPPLPVWPQKTRGVPNICLRSALFGVIQRGRRKAVKGELVAAVKGLDIRYTGWRLDQGDFDVLAHALHLASRQKVPTADGHVQFTVNEFLHGIGRKAGKSGREWLKDSLRRLTASAVEIKAEIRHGYGPESYTYAGSLMDEYYYSTKERKYSIKINPKLASLFDAGWTQLQWHQRLYLKTNLAKWLHGFYASHGAPYPMKVQTLKHLCGSECKRLVDYRRKLRSALNELCETGAIESWKIDKQDKVVIEKKKKRLGHSGHTSGT